MSSSYTDIFSGSLLPPVYNSFASYTFSTNLVLNWSTQFVSSNFVVSSIMDFTPSAGGLTVQLPDCTQTSVGQQFIVNNLSAHNFNLIANDGTTVITTINGPSVSFIYLISNSTSNGSWIQVPFSAGSSAVTSVSTATTGNAVGNITISPSTITTVGTFTFNLGNDLGALTGFTSGTGIACRTAANTWALRTLAGVSNQIAITLNAGGVAGNPTIGLDPNIKNVTTLQVGGLQLGSNTLSAFSGGSVFISPQANNVTATQFPLALLPSVSQTIPGSLPTQGGLYFYDTNVAGPYYLSLQAPSTYTGGANIALTLPAATPLANQILGTSVGSATTLIYSNLTFAYLPQAVVQFTGIGSAGPVTPGFNQGITSVVLSGTTGQYTITFSSAFSATTYMALVTIQTSSNTTFTYAATNTSATVCNITLYNAGSASDFNGVPINMVFFGPRSTY